MAMKRLALEYKRKFTKKKKLTLTRSLRKTTTLETDTHVQKFGKIHLKELQLVRLMKMICFCGNVIFKGRLIPFMTEVAFDVR